MQEHREHQHQPRQLFPGRPHPVVNKGQRHEGHCRQGSHDQDDDDGQEGWREGKGKGPREGEEGWRGLAKRTTVSGTEDDVPRPLQIPMLLAGSPVTPVDSADDTAPDTLMSTASVSLVKRFSRRPGEVTHRRTTSRTARARLQTLEPASHASSRRASLVCFSPVGWLSKKLMGSRTTCR